jgi:ATP-dependent RNA helicase RhlE
LFESVASKFEGRVGVIHSNKEQNHRFNTVKLFKDGTYQFLIASDIVARGIDIAEVSHVINFDTPDVPENYIHRIGRTGRFDKKGIAITFTTQKEAPLLEAIESLMQYQVPVVTIPNDVEISSVLTEDEIPKVIMKEISQKVKKVVSTAGPAFHEKSAKNSKSNVKTSRRDVMQKKYKKPIKRGAKKK